MTCDFFIVASMTYYLSKSKSRLRTGRAKAILARLIALSLETGLLCTIVTAVDLAFFLALPESTYHLAPALVVSKLYTNSMLSVRSRVLMFSGYTSHISTSFRF